MGRSVEQTYVHDSPPSQVLRILARSPQLAPWSLFQWTSIIMKLSKKWEISQQIILLTSSEHQQIKRKGQQRDFFDSKEQIRIFDDRSNLAREELAVVIPPIPARCEAPFIQFVAPKENVLMGRPPPPKSACRGSGHVEVLVDQLRERYISYLS